jgi:hypothetical protein
MADIGGLRVTLQLVEMTPAGEAVAGDPGLVTVERVIVDPERQRRCRGGAVEDHAAGLLRPAGYGRFVTCVVVKSLFPLFLTHREVV